MAYYLVKAKHHKDLLTELRSRLDSGEIEKLPRMGAKTVANIKAALAFAS